MTTEEQLKLQAFLDGELPEREARKVAAWIQNDREAARLLAELKNTRQAIADAEPQLSLPESREFYWSKIVREIQRLQSSETKSREPVFSWRRLLWPVSLTVGAFAVCFLVVIIENPTVTKTGPAALISPDPDAPIVEPAQKDAEAITYEDKSDGTTLVWFSEDENSASPKTF